MSKSLNDWFDVADSAIGSLEKALIQPEPDAPKVLDTAIPPQPSRVSDLPSLVKDVRDKMALTRSHQSVVIAVEKLIALMEEMAK